MEDGSGVRGDEELRRFAREHHVSYCIEREAPAAREHLGSTFEVQLFATHGEDRLEAPACPRCVELTRELTSFASELLALADAGERAEILPPTPVIYASTDPQGPDEVSLVLRVMAERAAPDGHLRRIEDGLKALGIPRR